MYIIVSIICHMIDQRRSPATLDRSGFAFVPPDVGDSPPPLHARAPHPVAGLLCVQRLQRRVSAVHKMMNKIVEMNNGHKIAMTT
jgi:hypothetical protein